MSIIDWIITALPLLVVLGAALYSQRYIKSVGDFTTGGRLAGRYLLCIAGGELQAGAVVFVAAFEVFSHSGFAYTWWTWLSVPVVIIQRVSGFVVYRFRETRAMTLAQFFEIRYNKSFRLFTGLLGFLAGIANFGIIPAIGARCLVYFLGLPENISFLSLTLPTYIPLMALFLSITVLVAVSGGLITVMIINCIEGIISQIFYLVIIFALLSMFNWHQISTALASEPPGHSMLNPFDTSGVKDFNLWFVLMALVIGFYRTNAWQNAGGYNAAGYSAHEGRMGGVLSNWREMGKFAVITLLAACAYTYLHHPDFAVGAAHVQTTIHQIANEQAREQMESPIALANFLPVGIKGVFCAVLLMGLFGGDATHLHSWGTIFVQDFLVPLRKKPFEPKVHIWILRCSIMFVAAFAFVFGISFKQTQYINMWWAVTEGIFVGGAGSAIIGGLYWKKGTAWGAWSAMITGSSLAVGGIVAQTIYGPTFPLNGTQVAFFSGLVTITVYMGVSLLTYGEDFNLDRMLHRGEFAKIKSQVGDAVIAPKSRISWGKLIGLDNDFTLGDKWIAGGLFAWSMIFLFIFIIGTIWNLIAPWPISVWSGFWHFVGITIPIFFAVVTGIWFTWGGVKDMRDFFRRLRGQRINHLDDGTVVNHQNLDEQAVETNAPSPFKH